MIKKNIEAIYHLSPAQEGMLYDTLQAPASGIHIEQFICTLEGKVDSAAFQRAWQHVMNEHAILRTCFIWEGQKEPLQVVLREVMLPFTQQDWRAFSMVEQSRRLDEYVEQDRQLGFEPSHAPLMRIALFQTSDHTHQFVWTHHHILMDGWCRNIVVTAVLTCYRAFLHKQAVTLEHGRPYKDYIAWLRKQNLSQAERFWRKGLQGFLQPTPLGRDAQGEDYSEKSERFCSQSISLSPSTTGALRSLVGQHRLTLNTLVQGAWALLLSRYSGMDDVVFGITVSGRSAELSGIETMIGLCINTFPVRVNFAADAELWSCLNIIQAYNLELRQYEYCPGGRVHQWSEVPGSMLLYESLMVVENYPMDLSMIHSSDLSLTHVRPKGAQTKYPLTIIITFGKEMNIVCIYDTMRLSSRSVSFVLDHFRILLEYIALHCEGRSDVLKDLIPIQQIPIVKPLSIQHASEMKIVSPGNVIDAVLLEVWSDVLGVEIVDIHSNFFTLGGHSLLATQLISRIRIVLGVELQLRMLFEAPTIALLSQRIMAILNATQNIEIPPLEPVARSRNLPLSFAQQRLWFLDQLVPGTISYNIARPMRLSGPLDVAILEHSLCEILRRHEILRTSIGWVDSQFVQVISPVHTLDLPVIDVSLPPISTTSAQITSLLARQAWQYTFDLTHGPLIRFTLLRLAKNEQILLLVVHHIIFDVWSESIFMRELMTLYDAFAHGRPSPLPELPLQYADFALWQRAWLQGETLKKLVAYWKKQLYDAPTLQLPVDHPHPLRNTFRGSLESFALSTDLSNALRTLSRAEGVTLFMTLLAAFQVLLYRYSGQEDIVVGTDIANRTRSELETLIGFFVNLLALRTNLGGNPPFRVLLQHVREMMLIAYAHQDLPFEKLIETLQLDRVANQTPLIRALFVFQNVPMPHLTLHNVTITPILLEASTTNFDLAVFMWEGAEGLSGGVNYRSDLFEPSTITTFIERFTHLLNSIVRQPETLLDALDMYSSVEQVQHLATEAMQRESRGRRLRIVKREDVGVLSEDTP